MPQSEEQKQSLSQYGRLLVALAKGGVDYAIAGGLAVIFNGHPRLTMDADIIVDDAPENLRRMLAVLKGWGEGWARELSLDDFPPEEGAIRVVEDFELDIFTRLRGKSYCNFKPGLRSLELAGTRLYYLSPQDLLHCKQGSVREKDQLDTLALQKIIQQEHHQP